MSENIKPWERQKGESDQAFEAFAIYRDMYIPNERKRSLRDVAQQLNKSLTLMSNWNKKWNWQKRCEAYDRENDRKAAAKHRKDVNDAKNNLITISYTLERKAVDALNQLDAGDLTAKDIKETLKLVMEIQEKYLMTDQHSEDQNQGTLADAIVAAYQKRKGGDDS